jgi:membrane fusion protein (multidrug efflux system)
LESSSAEVKAAQARLETAKIDLGYTKIHAPISGIVSQKEMDLGNLVTHGTSLVSITQTDPIYAKFSIPDTDISKIRQALKTDHKTQQQKIDIDVSLNLDQFDVDGKVDYIAPVIDPKTSSVQARAVFSNTDNTLMPGGFGRITFQGLNYSNAILIPQKSVLQNPQGTIIFIVEEGKVAIRPVKLGDSVGENYLVEAPLRPGDKIIVNNFFRIKPGVPVAIDKIVNAESE